MSEYRGFSKDELLAALGQADRAADVDLIRVCLERSQELTPALLQALEDGPDPAWAHDDPRGYLDIHAGLLLCAYCEPAALPVFGRAFRDEERDYLQEWFTYDLPSAYGPAAMLMLLELMNDERAYTYARSSAMAMLVAIAQNHPEELDRIVAAFRSLLPALAADGALPAGTEDSELWTWVALSLSDLTDEASLPQITALYRAGMIDKFVLGDEKEYLHRFGQPINPAPRRFDILELYEELNREEAQAIEKREQVRAEAKGARLAVEPSRRPTELPKAVPVPAPQVASVRPKIGRNDPCWCGSGLKYKRCHWKQDREKS